MRRFEKARSLAEIFRAQARAQPQATAQIFGDRVTTYGALDRRASQVANGLAALGAGPGTRIGYLGKNSDLYFELLLGALKANVVLVPVNWRLAPPEAAAILADAEVDILFVGPGYAPMAEAIAHAGHAVRAAVSMDGASAAWPDFATWRDAQADGDPMLPVAPEDTVIQLYTSGTTGLPKGVELTNNNYLALLAAWEGAGFGDIGPADVVLTCMPVFHVAGVDMGILALIYGATNVVMEEVNVPGLLDLIPRHGVTVALLVPAVVLALVQHPDAERADLRSLRRLLYGASPIAEATVLRAKALLPGTELWQLYGLTETTGGGTYLPPALHEGPGAKLRSCGRPYPGFELRIVGPPGETLASRRPEPLRFGRDVRRHRLSGVVQVREEIALRLEIVADPLRRRWRGPFLARAGVASGGVPGRIGAVQPHDRVRQLTLAPLAGRTVGVGRLLTSESDDLAHLLRRELRRRDVPVQYGNREQIREVVICLLFGANLLVDAIEPATREVIEE